MIENLTPCKECQHYAICRITDTYLDNIKSLGEVAMGEHMDVKVRCKYFNHANPTAKRAIVTEWQKTGCHYDENK